MASVETIQPLLSVPGLKHFISTRAGGVSQGPFSSLNLGYHVGDDPLLVQENRKRLAGLIGLPTTSILYAQQVHGTTILSPTTSDLAAPPKQADGFLLNTPRRAAAIMTADCAAVLIADGTTRSAALLHAGWRGAALGIVPKGIQALQDLGVAPANLVCGFGPMLCSNCLEIGRDVATNFANSPALISSGSQFHLDLKTHLTAHLIDSGVPKEQIFYHGSCPRCQNHRFFSHRGQRGTAGRCALVAWWQK